MSDNRAIKLLGISPLIPAGENLADTVAFYVEKLGFTKAWGDENMAGVERDGISILLCQSRDKHWAENTSFRIRVENVDALFAEFSAHGGMDMTEMKLPPWGTREFHLRDPFGVCIHFWEPAE